MKPNPQSRASRVLARLATQDNCTVREYLRIVNEVAGERTDVVTNDLHVRGLVERRVVLTAKGREVLGQIA